MLSRWPLRMQLFALSLSAAIPLVGVIAYNVRSTSATALANAQLQTSYVAESMANNLRDELLEIESGLSRLAEGQKVQVGETRCSLLMQEAKSIGRVLTAVSLYDSKGNPVCTNPVAGESTGSPDSAWFDETLRRGAFTLSDVFRNPQSGRWEAVAAYPTRSESGNVSGVLAIHFDLAETQGRVMKTSPKVTVVGIFDRSGTYAMRTPDPGRWIGTPARDQQKVMMLARERFTGSERLRAADGVFRVYSYRPVARVGWIVGAGVPEDDVFSLYFSHLRRDVYVAFIALILAFLAWLSVSRSILRPIEDLHRTAKRAAEGDQSARASEGGAPEISTVARELNRMLDIRDAAQSKLGIAEERFHAIFRSARDAIVITKKNWRVVEMNGAAEELFGITSASASGQPFGQYVPEAPLRAKLLAEQSAAQEPSAAKQRIEPSALMAIRQGGEPFPIEATFASFLAADQLLHTIIFRDVTLRLEADRREARLKNFYAALSQTNQGIVRITNLSALYARICKVCVEYGNASMAYIALVEGTRLVPVAWSGPAEAFLGGIQLSLDPQTPSGNGPMANAVREGRPYVSNDFLNDPNTVPWRGRAQLIGTRATAAFPFRKKDAVFGVLSVHVTELDFFDAPLIALMEELTGDLSFAIDNAQREALRARAERELREANERFERIVSNAPSSIVVSDLETGKIILANDAFCETFGYARETLMGKTGTELRLWATTPTRESLLAALDERQVIRGEEGDIRNSEGEVRTVLYGAQSVEIRGRSHLLLMLSDITDRKRSQEQIRYLATHDVLTQLPNRRLIRDQIDNALQHAVHAGSQVAVMYLDLDRFKVINDSHGHAFGDDVLRAVADRLAGLLPEQSMLARESGDEFLILLRRVSGRDETDRLAREILRACEKPLSMGSRDVFIGLSIGVSHYPEDGTTAEALIDHADIAMYRAKDAGRRRVQHFSADMSDHNKKQSDLEAELRNALEAGQLSLAYQPKANLGTGHLSGYEALLRWTNPSFGSIPPATFIPIAEQSGLIEPIGNWALQLACSQSVLWHAGGHPLVPVSVNVSARQFYEQDVVSRVTHALESSGLAPELLELELTERLIARDQEKVLESVRRLKTLGVRLSIDDFGTGHSSLAYLSRFPVDALKIDRSFVRNMLVSTTDRAIVLAIISLAHTLKIDVIAEGVEGTDEASFLRDSGCDQFQGHLLAPALSPAQFEDFLRARYREGSHS